ncbi:prefoldin subunit 4 isoform X1 [Pteropus medius]|uniref:prefoldin subunit 4 isoform X1 n=1 Tax=Pteropus vampyrus TaxID=132908 RepID=UPI00196A95F1|nr:prefoldin subunit 4 isoform X1 [Pteropus giganteus]
MPGCSARKPGVGPRAEAPSPAGGPAARPARAPRVVLGPRPAKAGRRPGTLGGLWAAPRGAEDGPGECEGPAAQALSLGCRKPQVPLTAAGHTAGRFTWVVASDPPRFTGHTFSPTKQDKLPFRVYNPAAEDVNVTFEDQQKINKFARNTSRITELKEEIDVKKKQLQNLEDACEDIMLADDDCLMMPYQIGDVFISHSQEETQEMLEEAKKNLQEEIDALESRVEAIQRVLADLKVQLYAKFGSNINLEADES